MFVSRATTALAVIFCIVLLDSATVPAREGRVSLSTDRSSYGPFDVVSISGLGLAAGDALRLQVTDPDGIVRSGDGLGSDGPDDVNANEAGALSATYNLAGRRPDGIWYAGRSGGYVVALLNSTGETLATAAFTVSLSKSSECTVTRDGAVLCVGSNALGQLGDGTFNTSLSPVEVLGLDSGVAKVSSSGTHACALLVDGTVVCWGSNVVGQLGDGTFVSSATPVTVVGLADTVDDIVAGNEQTCARLLSGEVVCWGFFGVGPAGDGPFVTTSTPISTASFTDHASAGKPAGSARLNTTSPADTAPAAPASFARSVDPDFFWLPPTVPANPTPTGPFDTDALRSLTVEVCELNSDGACVGNLIEKFSSTSNPTPSRIKLDKESYTVTWLTGPSHVDRDAIYQMRVLKAGTLLGVLDVDFVQNTPELALVDASRYVGIVRGQQLSIRFRVQRPTARTRVKINEIESNGGVPGDWAELYNTAAVPLSLAGYVVRDNDDGHSYTLPTTATIPALGYYVVEEAQLGFGLGAGDAVRLLTADASVVVDSYTWTAHAVTSYGRCPNGIGDFQTNTTVTKGAANDCSIVIRINEIESDGGTPGDWVELFNPGPGPANLTGFAFRGSSDATGYSLPGVVVPAGSYLVLDATTFGFSLGSPDGARLFRPDGTLADSYAWTTHASTTYGRCPNGSGAFATTLGPTKGAANNCFVPVTTLQINEVESSGGSPGDWIELFNTGATPINLSGWLVRDNDDTHNYLLPAGTTIGAGGYLLVEEAALNFGLGAADSVRIYDPTGALYQMYSWTAHAATTYGRCPNGTGAFITTTSVTKGAANDCGAPIRINEIESNLGSPGDWVELRNVGVSAVNVAGFVFRDNDDTHTYAIPAGTSIPAGGYFVLDEAAFGFGLGSGDSARLYDAGGQLLDSYVWTTHAATTYGRCPDGTGAFTTTVAPTKGTANSCPNVVVAQPWPGDPDFQTVDGTGVFGGNLSGLMYEDSDSPAPGVIWAVRNGPSTMYRLVWNGTMFTPDTANNWSAGKTLLYPNGGGAPDSEGVTFTSAGPAGGMYVSTERDNNVSGVSRNSILRFDVSAPGASLTATHEWNLTADLPVVGPNLGIEAITWIPDSFLVSRSFVDESKSQPYNPASYPNHGSGLFFVGVEANGNVYAYALDHVGGGFTRVATIASSLTGVMDIQFDADTSDLWAVCDDTCNGQSVILRINVATGKFGVARLYDRPGLMPNLNNEGFAIAPLLECVGNRRPVYYADDGETGGHSIRRALLSCGPLSPAPLEQEPPSGPADLPIALAAPAEIIGGPVLRAPRRL